VTDNAIQPRYNASNQIQKTAGRLSSNLPVVLFLGEESKMADKQKAVLNRLTKKLSALRATLSKDERILLDRIVLSTPDVSGHKMVGAASGATSAARKATRANEVALHKMTDAASGATSAARKATKVNEVALHKMTDAASGATSAARKATKVTEVALHGMTDAASGATTAARKATAANAAASAAANAAASGAVFAIDATTGGYRVNDGATI
jgi:hypothetical protein